MKKILLVCMVLIMVCIASGCQTEHVHDYGEWTVTTAALCEVEGVETRTCDCGKSQSRKLDALRHYYQDRRCVYCDTPVPTSGLVYESNGDGTCTLIGIGSCEKTEIVIPQKSLDGDQVTGIADGAFNSKNHITSVVIPEGVTVIGERAFEDCKNLKSITVPDSIESIGSFAFFGCDKLNTVTHLNGRYLGGKRNPHAVLIGVADVTATEFSVSDTTRVICDQAFADCVDLKTVSIPESVLYIGKAAFYRCRSLTEVSFPSKITRIAPYTFYECSSLKSFTVRRKVTIIGNEAFYGCSSLESVDFKNLFDWKVGYHEGFTAGRDVYVDDPVAVVEYLTDTYTYHWWKQGTN